MSSGKHVVEKEKISICVYEGYVRWAKTKWKSGAWKGDAALKGEAFGGWDSWTADFGKWNVAESFVSESEVARPVSTCPPF